MKKIKFFLLLLLPVFTIAQTPLKMRDSSITGPQTFAMVVGVSKYRYVRPLQFAHRDAELFRDYLKSPAGGGVKEENIFCLLNEEAINSTFWAKGFQWLKAKQLRRGDRLFLYLAGHGDAIDNDQYFFLTYDCNPGGDKNNYLAGGAIQLFNLKKKIANETAKGVEVYLVMDACRSNELPGGAAGMSLLNSAVSETKTGEVIMLATGAGEASLEDRSFGNGHGLFTYYLVDALSGVADNEGNKDNRITFREVQTYIGKHVPSIAQQRFNRKQAPYFCCGEFDNKVINTVDTNYLNQWLKKKRNESRGGNSFPGEYVYAMAEADTLLVETYNRFNEAIRKKQFKGETSAEEYFRQLSRKYPGNPYTLDAKSSLVVAYIDAAQEKINNYLSCSSDPSEKEKQTLFDNGINLEKAIEFIREDEPEFAATFRGRINFLKSNGNFGNTTSSFQFAHAGVMAEPGAAYLENQLALLHLANNRKDSALFYAEKATRSAPNWRCAFTTLALVRDAISRPSKPADTLKKKNNLTRKVQWGMLVGGGITKPQLDPRTPTTNDTIRALSADGAFKFDLGITANIRLTSLVSIRPTFAVSFEKNEINYERRGPAGGIILETVPVETFSILVPVPVKIRFSNNDVAPYVFAGPTFSLLMQGDDENARKFAVKPIDLFGDVGLGVDISVGKGRIILSPELKYSKGLGNVRDPQETGYSNAVSKLTRQHFTFSILLSGR